MHNFVHIQILVTDFELAKKFYHEIFQWHFYTITEMKNYLFYRIDEKEEYVGGAFVLVDKIPQGSSVVLYINTEQINDDINEIKKLGGQITQPVTKLPGENGYIARFKDPFGNIMGMWTEAVEN